MTERDLINQFPDATRKHREPKESFEEMILREYGPDKKDASKAFFKHGAIALAAALIIAVLIVCIVVIVIFSH